MTPFVTNTQFLQRFDFRWIAQNITDNGVPPTLTQLQSALSASGAVLAELLSDASEVLMGAAAVGARYSENDIRVYGGSLLLRVVSNLTMGLVLQRRGRAVSDEKALSQPYAEVLETLELLRRGERVFFNVPDVPEAGLPGTASMLPRLGLDPPLLSQDSFRYFGSLGGCYPYGQVQGLPDQGP